MLLLRLTMCLVRSDSLRRISLQEMRTYGIPFFFAGSVFHTLCFLFAASLTVVNHVIGLRLEALKHDYLLVLKS